MMRSDLRLRHAFLVNCFRKIGTSCRLLKSFCHMVSVGVIGLGPTWETRYAPVLKKLRNRIAVCAVYDPLSSRAEQTASQLQTALVGSITALLDRSDVQAVLLLESAWHGFEALKLVSRGRKPAYIACNLGDNLKVLSHFQQQVQAQGQTIFPEFSRRFTPATSRLQELMATQLGRPLEINIEASSIPGEPNREVDLTANLTVGLLDWCRYIIGTPAVALQVSQQPSTLDTRTADCTIHVEFEHHRSGSIPPAAQLRISSPLDGNTLHDETPDKVTHKVVCERGTALLNSATDLTWTVNSTPVTESLTADRSNVEVMLDLFCRRVAGGLIPIADLSDLCRGLRMAHTAEESRRSGRPVQLGGLEGAR